MGLDSLKQQIRQMQALKINGIYILNSSQRNILDDVVKKLDGFMCIPRKQLEEIIDELDHKPVPQPFRADNFRTGWLNGVSLGVKQLRKLLRKETQTP